MGARSELPAHVRHPDAVYYSRQFLLVCVLALYFLALGAGTGWLVAVVCRHLCGLLSESCGPGGAALCGVSVLALSAVGLAFFLVFGIASVPMLGCVLAVLGPPCIVIGVCAGTISRFGVELGLSYALLGLAVVGLLLAWSAYAFGSLCRCVGWELHVEEPMFFAAASRRRPRTTDEVEAIVDRLYTQCVIVGRDLRKEGLVTKEELEEMSTSIIIGLPAVAVFRNLLASVRLEFEEGPPGDCFQSGGRPPPQPPPPPLFLPGAAASDLGELGGDPRAHRLAEISGGARRRLSVLRLRAEEAASVTEWLLGRDHLGVCECQERGAEIGAVVSAITGLTLDITRLEAFKRQSRQIFSEILDLDVRQQPQRQQPQLPFADT